MSTRRDRVAANEELDSFSSTVARVLYTGYFQELDNDDDTRNSPATQSTQSNSKANQTHNIIMGELCRMFEDALIVSITIRFISHCYDQYYVSVSLYLFACVYCRGVCLSAWVCVGMFVCALFVCLFVCAYLESFVCLLSEFVSRLPKVHV